MSAGPPSPFTDLEFAAQASSLVRQRSGRPDTLRRAGVVHTPTQVARAALHRLDTALSRELGLHGGLAREDLVVLDVALGTGVWLASLLSMLVARAQRPAQVIGVEADPVAADQAERLLRPYAERHGFDLRILCSNTLSLESPWPKGEHVRVMVGNPPWAARSLSRGLELSDRWLAEFRLDADGRPLDEVRTGVLSDDYVRFFRWTLEQARASSSGAALALTTNNSFLRGPVHREMRRALAESFDAIEVVDLGGNRLLSRGEQRDDGVFPVRVGAALTIAARKRGQGPRRALVSYARLLGGRQAKLEALEQETSLSFSHTQPSAPSHEFHVSRPRRVEHVERFTLAEAFPFHAEGVQSNRDALVTAASREQLHAQLLALRAGHTQLPNVPHLKPSVARERLAAALESGSERWSRPLAYRPFEQRYYFPVAPLCHRPRLALLQATERSSLCLYAARKEPGGAPWNMFGAGVHVADSSFLSVRSSCRTRVFPSHDGQGVPNVASRVLERMAERTGVELSSHELILYVLGVLGSPTFRCDHEEELRRDYACLPFPLGRELLEATLDAGRGFVALLTGPSAVDAELVHCARDDLDMPLTRSGLRLLSENVIEVANGVHLTCAPQLSLTRRVGHHLIVERAYGAHGACTLRELLHCAARAAMWSQAEKRADAAYQPARIVGAHADEIAASD